MTEKPGSAPTGNLSRHSLLEKSRCTSILSPEIPMTLAPVAAKFSMFSANSCASIVQTLVNDLGKKYKTTGPFFKASVRENLNSLPPSAASTVKSGAASPAFNAAVAVVGERPRQTDRNRVNGFTGRILLV